MIKNDVVKLVKVLCERQILFNIDSWLKDVENKDEKVATRLIDLLEVNISKEEIAEIMNEYYELKI